MLAGGPSHADALRSPSGWRSPRCWSIGGLIVPRSLLPLQHVWRSSRSPPSSTIASMGQSLVLMTRGIDLSIPAIITLSSTLLLGVSGGSDSGLAGGGRRRAARRDRGRPDQRHPGRAAAAERADRDAGRRRDPVGRQRCGTGKACRPNPRCRRCSPTGAAPGCSASTSRSGWRRPGRRAHHHPAQDDDRPALFGGRRQSARRPCRRHQPAALPDRRLRRSPACSTASPASCFPPSSATRRSTSATPICSLRSRRRCSAAPR